jgi:hypothetical protein
LLLADGEVAAEPTLIQLAYSSVVTSGRFRRFERHWWQWTTAQESV